MANLDLVQWVANEWSLALNMDEGSNNGNASNARILSQLTLTQPTYSAYLPSLAEALAVYASSTIVSSAIDSEFLHFWNWTRPDNIFEAPGVPQSFNCSMRSQSYTSGHIQRWQGTFYIILVIVFAINMFCLSYLIMRSGMVTDFTEPLNMFSLALNSPPSAQLNGSCGAGPQGRDLVVPWRVAYAPSANHYFFEEANDRPWRGKFANQAVNTNPEYGRDFKGRSYKRLSESRGWL